MGVESLKVKGGFGQDEWLRVPEEKDAEAEDRAIPNSRRTRKGKERDREWRWRRWYGFGQRRADEVGEGARTGGRGVVGVGVAAVVERWHGVTGDVGGGGEREDGGGDGTPIMLAPDARSHMTSFMR